jgi:hypothetical protein
MSLYRQAGGRPWAAIAVALVAGAAIGGLAGFLIGRGDAEEPTLADQIAGLQSEAEPVRLGLEQVTIEYRGTVRAGQVTSPSEYEAARSTVERAIASLDVLRPDLEALNPPDAERLDRALLELSRLVDRTASLAAVEAQASRAERALLAAVGSDRQPVQ